MCIRDRYVPLDNKHIGLEGGDYITPTLNPDANFTSQVFSEEGGHPQISEPVEFEPVTEDISLHEPVAVTQIVPVSEAADTDESYQSLPQSEVDFPSSFTDSNVSGNLHYPPGLFQSYIGPQGEVASFIASGQQLISSGLGTYTCLLYTSRCV